MEEDKKDVFIKLRKQEDVKMFKRFQKMVKESDSDVTKTTKRLWKNYLKGE